jgi:hypothetical protein
MIGSAIKKNCGAILDESYPLKCIVEWAKTTFSIDLKLSDVAESSAEEIETLVKQRARENVANEISVSIGEYLEDYEDRQSWDVPGLCKWAMIAFHVSLSLAKVKTQQPEEIEEQLVAAAAEQVDKKDCSQLNDFLKKDFALRRLAEWAQGKFGIRLDVERLKDLNAAQIHRLFQDETAAIYRKREIEYPVEFAMNMVYGPQGTNVYAFESLVNWANKKYNAGLSIEQVQNAKPKALYEQLLQLSESYNNGRLDKEVSEGVTRLNAGELINWANERFEASLSEKDSEQGPDGFKEKIYESAREFFR